MSINPNYEKKFMINSTKAFEEHKKIIADQINNVIAQINNLKDNPSNFFLGFNERRIECCENLLKKLEASIKSQVSPTNDDVVYAPLEFTMFQHEQQGPRETMEDAHFYKEIPQGVLLGLFDGHGGNVVADYANSYFQENFSKKLSDVTGNVKEAFTQIFNELQKEVKKKDEWKTIGTTAVVCFIDKDTNKIYTATLGDSEANIYRNKEWAPLSCIRNWTTPKDSKRAIDAIITHQLCSFPNLEMYLKKEVYSPTQEPKKIYFPFMNNYCYGDINVSRAIGDTQYDEFKIIDQKNNNEVCPISHKPKITVYQLRPGDVLVLACDGLFDYVSQNEIIEIMNSNLDPNIAPKLVDYAINQKYSQDNVTVLVVKATDNLTLPQNDPQNF